MPTIGPHRFTITAPGANDLHILYRFSGGSLRNPRVVDGPPPQTIGAKQYRVNITWQDPLPQGTTVTVEVDSDFAGTTPYNYVLTRDGQPLGPPIPFEAAGVEPRPWSFTADALESRPALPDAALEVINRRLERAPFDAARLIGSLVLGDRPAAEARAAAATLEPLLRAVGHSPISTTALRAAVGEVLLNPARPDGSAIRDAILVGDGGPHLDALGPPEPIEGEDELVVQVGLFLQKVERVKLLVGQRPPESLAGLYDEGVALHAAACELARAGGHFCLHPLTGVPIAPAPPPLLEELLRREKLLDFTPAALLELFFAPDGSTDWEAVAKEVLFKVLGVFGLIDFYNPILEILMGAEFADVWRELLAALAKKGIKAAIYILIKKFLLSAKFRELLIKKLGKEAAEKILKKIAEKWIPVVGWAVLVANVLAVIIVQLLYYASIVFGPLIL